MSTQEQEDKHNDEYQFCDQTTCDCHDDQDKVMRLYEQNQDGLITDEERDRYYWGGTI